MAPLITLYLPSSSESFHPLPSIAALRNSSSLFPLSIQHTPFAIVLFYGRKIVTRVHSYFTILFREMPSSSSAIAAIHHANTAENCQIAPQLLHPTAQGTRRAGTDSSKACRQHEEESDICDSKGQKVGYSRSSTCHGCRY